MIIPFFKMHGTGNDFIVIDNRPHLINKYTDNQELIEYLCNRHFGIGADGLILLNTKVGYHFEMIYYNADGKRGTMCGNGGRCAVAAADMLSFAHGKYNFWSSNKPYNAFIVKKKDKNTFVRLFMNNVNNYKEGNNFVFIDTGSPHHIVFVDDADAIDVVAEGRDIRYSDLYPEGTNVNFVEIKPTHLYVRTYERGVENETLSCGTGVVAAAIASYIKGFCNNTSDIKIITHGGELNVGFQKNQNAFTNIILEASATLVFKGEIEI